MKRIIAAAAALAALFLSGTKAQAGEFNPGKWEDYGFRTVLANPVTGIKDQYNSGTCWCFATTSFLESESIRIKGLEPASYPDFSEMFTLYRAYLDRSYKYLLLDAHLTSGPGSISCDLLHVVEDYGIVPDSAMPCKTGKPELFDMDKEIRSYLKGILEDKDGKSKERSLLNCSAGMERILVKYLGKCPGTFALNGKEYTPASYRDECGIVAGDYVTLTSFTHHPFYERFALEVPDNWRWDSVWNIPLDELQATLDYALENGYTVAWGTDISEPGYTSDGLAVLPQKEISQELRQRFWDTKQTVDDHMMHIFGLARSKTGEKFYMVKNSSGPNWGDPNRYWYASVPFFRGKTIYLTLHRDAIPEAVRDKIMK